MTKRYNPVFGSVSGRSPHSIRLGGLRAVNDGERAHPSGLAIELYLHRTSRRCRSTQSAIRPELTCCALEQNTRIDLHLGQNPSPPAHQHLCPNDIEYSYIPGALMRRAKLAEDEKTRKCLGENFSIAHTLRGLTQQLKVLLPMSYTLSTSAKA